MMIEDGKMLRTELAYSLPDFALPYKAFLLVSFLMGLLFSMEFIVFFFIKTKNLHSVFSKFSMLFNKNRKIIGFVLAIWLGIFAFTLRWHALNILDVEVDEKFYLPASMHYANAIKNRDWNDVIHYDFNIEHPVFTKLIYAISILVTRSVNDFQGSLIASRVVSALFTVGNVILISFVNPIAGFFLAVNSWSIMYSSVAYLDSSTAFFATLAVLAFNRSKSKLNKYLIISAIATGMGFASKYSFMAIPAALSLILLWKSLKQNFAFTSLKPLVCYGAVSIFTFFLCDPILWTNTGERLILSLFFHPTHWESPWVTEANLPIYHQFVWLSTSNPWHAQKFIFHWDAFVLFLGLLGFPFLYKRNKIYGAWYLATASFLFFYPVKWPQYTLIFIPPLTLAIGELIRFNVKAVYERLKPRFHEEVATHAKEN